MTIWGRSAAEWGPINKERKLSEERLRDDSRTPARRKRATEIIWLHKNGILQERSILQWRFNCILTEVIFVFLLLSEVVWYFRNRPFPGKVTSLLESDKKCC